MKTVCVCGFALTSLLASACGAYLEPVDYREEMRKLVMELSEYADRQAPGFYIVPQNGQELATDSGEATDFIRYDYLHSIDGVGREDLLFGYDGDDLPTPEQETLYMKGLCDLFLANGIAVLVTDYCATWNKVHDSYLINNDYGYISFAADQRDLTTIPAYPADPYNENADDILSPAEARNFLYLINSQNYYSKQDFIDAVADTNFDMVIMDLFHEGEPYTAEEISELKYKNNGGRRLVLCYASIGEAEDYRYYWQDGWTTDNPNWFEAENADWEGNYKVRYWDPEWQGIIFGNDDSYVKKIIDTGFDGAYLDIIDAFEYFEAL